jgi:serine/threonine protein kinase
MRYRYLNDVEPLDVYEPGGYHPVVPGQVLLDRYHIVHKLGYGGYSVIWLARDLLKARHVALKIGKSHDLVSLNREIAALHALYDGGELVPQVLQDFHVEGPKGRHTCYTMPVAAGTLASARYDDFFPIPVARALSARLAQIVQSFHANGSCYGGKWRSTMRKQHDRDSCTIYRSTL